MILSQRHLLAIEHMSPSDIQTLLDLADHYAKLGADTIRQNAPLSGHIVALCGARLEDIQRTAKLMGARCIEGQSPASIDDATLVVIRSDAAGVAEQAARSANVPVINVSDGAHESPLAALADAWAIRNLQGRLQRVTIAMMGDLHSNASARSALMVLGKLENRVRLIGPATLLPAHIEAFGVETSHDCDAGLQGVDVVLRYPVGAGAMDEGRLPSLREYAHFYGVEQCGVPVIDAGGSPRVMQMAVLDAMSGALQRSERGRLV